MLETDLTDNVDDDPPAENNAIEDTTEYNLKGGMKLVKRKRAKIIRSVRFNKEKEPENYYREQLMLYTPWRNEQKAAKNTANKNSKKKKMQPVPSKVASRVTAPSKAFNRLQNTTRRLLQPLM